MSPRIRRHAASLARSRTGWLLCGAIALCSVAAPLAVAAPEPAGAAAEPGMNQARPAGHPPIHAAPGSEAAIAAERAAHEHAKEEEDENAPPKPINWTDFGNKEQPPYLAALINFAILAFIYVYFGRKPIAAALKSRRDELSKQIEEAQKIKLEAEARRKQYASKLEDMGTELEETKKALAAAGATEKARIVREAEEKAARVQQDAVFQVEQERKQLRLDLQREAVQAALVSAEELLRGKLTLADQERVAEEFLATLTPGGAA